MRPVAFLSALGFSLVACSPRPGPPRLAAGTPSVVDLRCDAPTDVRIDAPSTSRVEVHAVEPRGVTLSFDVAACGEHGVCSHAWPVTERFEIEELRPPGRITRLRFIPARGCTPSRLTFWYGWMIVG